MNFRRPPAKRYRLFNKHEASAMETVLLHLSPYNVGQIGGEMARRMVDAAQSYLEEITANEIRKAFRTEIQQSTEMELGEASPPISKKMPVAPTVNHSAVEAPASQYPSGNDSH